MLAYLGFAGNLRPHLIKRIDYESGTIGHGWKLVVAFADGTGC
jgi:hypothetical protein